MLRRYTLLIALLISLLLPTLATAQDAGTHTVQYGENLFRIALRYGVDMDELASVNGITDPTRVFVGQVLAIPGLSAPDESDEIVNPLIAAAPVIHTVQRGEYLSQIADLYSVSMEDIMRANNIANPNRILPGAELQIWTDDISTVETTTEPVDAPAVSEVSEPPVEDTVLPTPAPAQSAQHIVAPGEHLSQIARQYGISWTRIAEANGITDPNRIFAGMQLTIPNTDPSLGNVTEPNQSLMTVDAAVGDPGPRWGYGREIVVDLSSQMTYAYEDGALVFQSLVSTGLPATPTVQGEYAIWHKTPAQTMSGPGYYLPNVQWVMYFYRGYGFHGTYWHENFGQPMSHGCVNMTNTDAQWLYNFASIGTNVYVQY